jgi:hypothetical protein
VTCSTGWAISRQISTAEHTIDPAGAIMLLESPPAVRRHDAVHPEVFHQLTVVIE